MLCHTQDHTTTGYDHFARYELATAGLHILWLSHQGPHNNWLWSLCTVRARHSRSPHVLAVTPRTTQQLVMITLHGTSTPQQVPTFSSCHTKDHTTTGYDHFCTVRARHSRSPHSLAVTPRTTQQTVTLLHIKGSKERYLLGQKHNLQIFGVTPFVKLQNDTWTLTVKLCVCFKSRLTVV